MYGSLFGSLGDGSTNTAAVTEMSLPFTRHESIDVECDVTSKTPLVELSSEAQKGEKRATIWSGFVNLANTIVGAGMLGLPGAFAGTGTIGGTLLLVTGAAFSAHGLFLLSRAAQQAGLPSSFYTVARAAVPQYTILIDLAVALKCFGVATGYLITVSDCMVNALDHLLRNADSEQDESFFITMVLSRRFWVVGAVVSVIPFSFFHTLDDLKKTSALALVFVFALAFGIIAYAYDLADACPDGSDDCLGEVVPFTDVPTTLSKLPIFVFAFTCHQNIFPIVNELENRTQERINRVIFASIGFAFFLFYIVAVNGYHTFGSNVRGDILLNYPENGYITTLRICIAFMLALHYPLQLDPSRRCISSLLSVVSTWREKRKRSTATVKPSESLDDKVTKDDVEDKTSVDPAKKDLLSDSRVFNTITICFLLLSFTIAMVVDDLGVVLAVVGATGSTLVSYILPGLIYAKLQPDLDPSKIMAYLQLFLGCLIMPCALYFVIMEEINH